MCFEFVIEAHIDDLESFIEFPTEISTDSVDMIVFIIMCLLIKFSFCLIYPTNMRNRDLLRRKLYETINSLIFNSLESM